MFDDDLAYYRQRASEERDRATTATDPSIAEIHMVLAAKYEAIIEQARARPRYGDNFGVAQA